MGAGERHLRDFLRSELEGIDLADVQNEARTFGGSPQGRFFDEFLASRPGPVREDVPPQFGAGASGFLGALGVAAQGPKAVGRFTSAVQESARLRQGAKARNVKAEQDELITLANIKARQAEAEAQFEKDKRARNKALDEERRALKVETFKSEGRDESQARKQQQADAAANEKLNEKQSAFRRDIEDKLASDLPPLYTKVLMGEDLTITEQNQITGEMVVTKTIPGVHSMSDADEAVRRFIELAETQVGAQRLDPDLEQVWADWVNDTTTGFYRRAEELYGEGKIGSLARDGKGGPDPRDVNINVGAGEGFVGVAHEEQIKLALADKTEEAIGTMQIQVGKPDLDVSPELRNIFHSALFHKTTLTEKNLSGKLAVFRELTNMWSRGGQPTVFVGMNADAAMPMVAELGEAVDEKWVTQLKGGGTFSPGQPGFTDASPWQEEDGRLVFDPSRLAGEFVEPSRANTDNELLLRAAGMDSVVTFATAADQLSQAVNGDLTALELSPEASDTPGTEQAFQDLDELGGSAVRSSSPSGVNLGPAPAGLRSPEPQAPREFIGPKDLKPLRGDIKRFLDDAFNAALPSTGSFRKRSGGFPAMRARLKEAIEAFGGGEFGRDAVRDAVGPKNFDRIMQGK